MSSRVIRGLRFVGAVVAPVLALALLTWAWTWFGSTATTRVPSTPPSLASVSSAEPQATLRVTRRLTRPGDVAGISDVASTGQWLVALAPDAARKLLVVDTATGELQDLTDAFRTRKISLGSTLIWPGAREGTFWIGASHTSQLTKASLTRSNGAIAVSTESFERSTSRRHSLELANGLWLSNGYFDDALASVERLEGHRLVPSRHVGRSLFPDASGSAIVTMLNRNVIAADPSGTHVAQSFFMSCRLHVYGADGTLERQVAAPVDVKLNYETFFRESDSQHHIRLMPDLKFCYVDVAATATGFVALFAGRAYGEHPDDFAVAQQVHAFTWDGRLVGVWQLDEPVLYATTDPTGTKLLAYQATPEPALVEIQLPIAPAEQTSAHGGRTRAMARVDMLGKERIVPRIDK